MLHRLHAGILLAFSLIKTLFIRYVLPQQQPGLLSFNQKFADDRLLPLTPQQRLLLPQVSGCLGCGRCSSVITAAPSHTPVSFLLASSRSMPEFDAAARMVEHITDDQLDAMRTRCPAQIPFPELVAFVRQHATQLNAQAQHNPPMLPAGPAVE